MTRRFDKEFKIHAVKLVVEEGKAVAQTARQLDISPKTLHKWVADYKKDAEHRRVSNDQSGHACTNQSTNLVCDRTEGVRRKEHFFWNNLTNQCHRGRIIHLVTQCNEKSHRIQMPWLKLSQPPKNRYSKHNSSSKKIHIN
ncbi:transposase [Parageobacillus thermoglucosidasius]|uniref:Transposase n=1 Tax=Parageobacillus thermoglucosidasius TaxID=1426 RepID=A0AB38R375_PARTM|nr:transposase [Parageobacillus thermoglucosidasius]RDE34169.1 transposase [Parageobacillus thermoglucosidasius]UOE77177.1 transposase [Parageobacillus thermoglucosidasius]GCD83623.1 hypothetical protein PTHTG4_26860 [Parageobacillus thermoglucosidasius]